MATNLQPASTYEGVDDIDGFADRASLVKYRSALLLKTALQVRFIQQQFGDLDRIAESCCGNARLLIALANNCVQLWGYDIAKSRIRFAEAWLTDLGIKNLQVFEENLFSFEHVELSQADLAVCITGAFGYFGALSRPDMETAILKITELVTPGGSLLLELYQHGDYVRMCEASENNCCKIWFELPEVVPGNRTVS